MDTLVKIISVKDSPGFDISTLTPNNNKVVVYTVGNHGPFTLTYRAGDYTQERVAQDVQREVDTLRGIGAIPAAGAY
jgi:hypothetical protein